MPIKKIKHVIWDWNGTILNDSHICVEVINEMLANRNLPGIDNEKYAAAMDFPIIILYKRVGFDFGNETFQKVADEFTEIYEKRKFECELRNEFVKTFGFLKKNDITMSILSAAQHKYLAQALKHFGVESYFDYVFGLEDNHATSKVENGLQLMGKLDIEKECCLMVGDSPHDYEVAAKMGIECWLFPSGHSTVEKLRKTEAKVFESTEKLISELNNVVSTI